MYCGECGTPVGKTAAFCTKCGTRLPGRIGQSAVGPQEHETTARTASQPYRYQPVLAAAPGRSRLSAGHWALLIIALPIAFLVSVFVYPVTLLTIGVVGLGMAVGAGDLRRYVTSKAIWKWLPWVREQSPAIGGLVLIGWALAASVLGYTFYSWNAGQTAEANAHATATALVRVHATGTVRAVAAAHATDTAVVRARARSTAQAIAQKTSAPRETATAASQGTAQAIARANSQATSQARAQQASSAATQAAQPSADTYADVNDHPDLHQGDLVQWTCNIAKFLGPDPNTSVNIDVGCWEYVGTYNGGVGDGEIILNVPPSVDTSSMHSGDDVNHPGLDGDFRGWI